MVPIGKDDLPCISSEFNVEPRWTVLLQQWGIDTAGLVNETGAYPALTRALGFPQLVNVLRIASENSDFDVLMRVDGTAYAGGGSIRLGPILCIGDVTVLARPSKWPTDALLRLRPRIAHVREGTPFGVAAERVVQWCTSRAFKAVRVKPTECLWVDYE